MNTHKSKMKTKFLIPVGIVLILVTAISFVLANNKKKIDEKAAALPQGITATPVKVAAIEKRFVDNSIQLTGSFAARQVLPLIAQTQGSIEQLNIIEGQRIGEGQVVARIDATAIQSNLATAQAAYNNAVKNKERFQRLAEAGAISQKQYEDVALNVENARANLQGIQQQLKYTIIRSPMSGIVSTVKVEKGSFATPGMQLGSIVDVSKLKMVLKVSEGDVIKLKEGQPVSIGADVYPGQEFKGNITLIGVEADAGRKYEVEVEISNNDKFPLKSGMFGTARLQAQTGEQGDRLFIPRQAIVGSIQSAQVFVLNSDNTVTLKNIEVQNQNGGEVVVLKGLTDSEKVITSGQINMKNGDKVRVVSQ